MQLVNHLAFPTKEQQSHPQTVSRARPQSCIPNSPSFPQFHSTSYYSTIYTIPVHSLQECAIQGEEMVEGYKELDWDRTPVQNPSAIPNPHTIQMQSPNPISIRDKWPAKYRTRPALRAVRPAIATGLQDSTGIATTTSPTQPSDLA